ncbi:hypothetical protein [Pedobacter jejuensis]|uniref:Uncharacterized protein n=1 Tax=Pedobacter jejuensis TaxID=1268550 RepID=A0A3N0C2K8_9SPHI|nr:hypothetical protein [Pedobacter jejuensis]RNL56672.1 hypothetical protein D7004_01915 [Pedobacter jejuensis]
MARNGIIKSLNSDLSGIITDENQQDIPFEIDIDFLKSLSGKNVSFQIELSATGLVAVDVQLLNSTI